MKAGGELSVLKEEKEAELVFYKKQMNDKIDLKGIF